MNRNQEQEEYLDLGHLIGLLWKHVVGILFRGLIFGALLFGYARFFKTPQFEANALFYVNNGTVSLSDAVRISTGQLNAANELVDTYAAILESRANMELVIEKSGVNRTYEKLRKMITASAVNSTGLFQITLTSSNPEEARVIANTIGYSAGQGLGHCGEQLGQRGGLCRHAAPPLFAQLYQDGGDRCDARYGALLRNYHRA